MIISFFYEKNPKITILFLVLVIGFLNLVSVDAKERPLIIFILYRPEQSGNHEATICIPIMYVAFMH